MSSYFDLHDCCILELSDEHRKRSRNGAVHHEEEHCHRYRRHRIHHRYRHCRSSRMRYDYLERSTYPTRHLCRNDFRRIPRSHGIAASLNTITNENETERGTHEHRAPLHFFSSRLTPRQPCRATGSFSFRFSLPHRSCLLYRFAAVSNVRSEQFLSNELRCLCASPDSRQSIRRTRV